MYIEENKSSDLAKLLSSFDYTFVDTCSLMDDGFPAWMDSLVAAREYLREGAHIIIPNKCLEELKKHSKNKEDDSTRIAAKRALKILKSVKHKKILELTKKDKTENFADNVIYTNVSMLRINYKVLIITQDKGLADDLRRLNLLDSQRGRKVSTYKIMPDGTLDVNKGETDHNYHSREHDPLDNRRVDDETKTKAIEPRFSREEKHVDFEGAVSRIVSADKRLQANLSNPNYPKSSRLDDIKAQLLAISKLPEDKKTTLKLNFNDSKLHEMQSGLLTDQASKLIPQTIKQDEIPKSVSKPEMLKTMPIKTTIIETSVAKAPEKSHEPTGSAPIIAKHLWYGEGSGLRMTLTDVAVHYGVLFRDPSVPYFKQVHGPFDLTTVDLDAIVDQLSEAMKDSNKSDIFYHGLHAITEKSVKGYKTWIDFSPDETSAKPASSSGTVHPLSPDAKLSKTSVSSLPSSQHKQVSEALRAPSDSSTIFEPADSGVVAVPKRATLIVAIPDSETANAIERRERRDSQHRGFSDNVNTSIPNKTPRRAGRPSMKDKAVAAKPASKIAQNAPKGQKTRARAVAKPAQARYAQKAPKPTIRDKQSSAVKTPIVQPSPAKKPQQPSLQQHSENIASVIDKAADAIRSEKRLMSNLHNPNYPAKDKLKDLQSQLEKVHALSDADTKRLTYTAEALKGMIALLK